jgi:hypothetical protein
MDNEFEDKQKEIKPEAQPESNPEEATGLQVESSLISSSKVDLKTSTSEQPVEAITPRIEPPKPIELSSEELLQKEITRLTDIKPHSLKISDPSSKKLR